MRLFYLSFEILNAERSQFLPDKIHHALRDELPVIRPELSWTHYRLLLKVERPDIRKFCLDECIAGNWSTRKLERQINSFYYERILASKNKRRVRTERGIAKRKTGTREGNQKHQKGKNLNRCKKYA